MLIRKLHLLIFLIALPLSAIAAEKSGGSITLADALARTLRGSPELAAYNYELRAAEARILQAGLRPNPELSLDIESPAGSGQFKDGDQMQNTLALSQLIELGGKRPARIAEAEAGRAVIEWEYQVKRVEVLKATTLAFIDTLTAQTRLQLAEEIVKVAGEAVALTDQRVNVGKASVVESIRTNVAVSSARIEVEQARRAITAARGNLAAQWGARQADFGAVKGDLENHPEGPDLTSLRQRLLGNPNLARWTAEREKREAILARQQTLARPDITLLAGPRTFGREPDATFVAGFSIPLPFNNRNQGNIAEARANLAKLNEEKRAAESRAFAALNEAYQKLMAVSEEIRILESSVIPGAQDAEKQLNEGYMAGKFTLLEVLDARRTLNAARVQQVRAHADFQKARAEIDALTARPTELPRGVARPKTMPTKTGRKK
jgi:cobalt-zinc-cadmium efflux system outer membrane protein